MMSPQTKAAQVSGIRVGERATAVEVICCKCQAVNAADRRFCSACGQSLWEKCLVCGTECSSNETFCGGCGINLKDFVQKQTEDIEAALTAVTKLERRFELDQAIRTLQKLTLVDDSRLAAHNARVREQLAYLRQKAEQQAAELQVGVQRIRDMIEAHAYGEATRLLDKLPRALRTEETEQLSKLASAKHAEILTLTAEIRAAIETKQYLDLAPKIQRLLVIKPDAENIRKLADQVRDRLLVAARKQLAGHEYKKAAGLMARIPECASNKEVEQLRQEIAEFNWLTSDLHRSPIIDEPLIEIAKRFAKLSPGDKANLELCSKLFRHEAALSSTILPAATRFPATPWAKRPERTHVGCPVDWLGGSQRLLIPDAAASSSWQAHPGRFFVAAGLALQGLGLAQVETNLHKAEKHGLLGQLSFGKRKESVARAWGIDVGDSSVKVVCLTTVPDQGAATLEYCQVFPHSIPLNRPESESCRGKVLSETIGAFLGQQTVEKTDQVCVSFPGHRVLGRFLRLPATAPKKRLEMIQFEARQQIPLPLDELAWSHQSFPDAEGQGGGSEDYPLYNTLLVAAKLQDVQELLRVLMEIHLPIHVLQSDCLALYNFAVYEGLPELATSLAKGRRPSTAIVDVGMAATNLVFSLQDRPWFRSFRVGGDHFTDAVAKQLHVTKDQAEALKFQPTRMRQLSLLYRTYDPVLSQITLEIQRSLEAFHKETGQPVANLLGVGGGFRLHGLWRYLLYGGRD